MLGAVKQTQKQNKKSPELVNLNLDPRCEVHLLKCNNKWLPEKWEAGKLYLSLFAKKNTNEWILL